MDQLPAVRNAKRPRRQSAPAAAVVLPLQGTGRVRVAGAEHYRIDVDGTSLRARRATSCLLQPEVGDCVAWCRGEKSSFFVYAVLERESTGPQQLVLTGDTRLSVRDGSLDLRSDRAIAIAAPKIDVHGDALEVRSPKATLVFETLETIARSCTATLAQVKLVGTQISSIFERVLQHAQHQRRVVEGLDTVEVRNADWRAKSLMNLQGNTVLTNGERLVKTRGAQIHLG